MPTAPSPSAPGACSTSSRATSSPDRTLLVRDGAVEAVAGPDDGLPDDARVIDLGGLTVLPGLIDTHSHLVGEVQTAGVPGTTTSAAQDALLGVSQRAGDGRGGLHDRARRRHVPGVRRLSRCATRSTAGEVEGPRMQCAGAFITAPWGGGDVVGLAHDIRLPDDLRFGVVTLARPRSASACGGC